MFKTTLKRVVFPVLMYSLVSFTVIITSGNSDPLTLSTAEETGLLIYRKYNCMTCHSIYGLGGLMGQDLTNVASRYNEQYVKNTILLGSGKVEKIDPDTGAIYTDIVFVKNDRLVTGTDNC